MAQKIEFYVQAHGGGQVLWKAMAKMDESWKEEKGFNILAHQNFSMCTHFFMLLPLHTPGMSGNIYRAFDVYTL